ncbi:MAG: hypothetical protein K0S37_1323 [Microbacterium sp.]|jgi:hypothetical protein|nr:hypothetical protein [Microbacterium sp.]
MTNVTDDGGLTLSYQQKVTVEIAEEASFAMRTTDWARLRKRVHRLKKQRREFAAAAWAFVGIGISALLSMVSWAPANRALPPGQQIEFAWIWPALWAMLILGVLMSAGMFWAAHVTKNSASETIDALADDMDGIRDVRAILKI